MEGLQVLTLEDVISEANIFVTTTGIIMVSDMKKRKNNAIVCNIGHFDNEININGLETYPGVKRITIKPQTDKWVFPETKTGIQHFSFLLQILKLLRLRESPSNLKQMGGWSLTLIWTLFSSYSDSEVVLLGTGIVVLNVLEGHTRVQEVT
ncbi:hypothetical protein MKX01_022837 [Papaver californicum]|nr:hypothetical protein MKX01_022837 [Papaver californicum]